MFSTAMTLNSKYHWVPISALAVVTLAFGGLSAHECAPILAAARGDAGNNADDEALEAARGETVARLTYLNDDGDADGPSPVGGRGARVVEVYDAD